MNEKLTYEEWRKRYTVSLGDDIKSQLQELHNIDADAERQLQFVQWSILHFHTITELSMVQMLRASWLL